MKIVPIFGEYLKAIKYPNEKKDEFRRLLELWQDPEYLEEFFESHKADLLGGFWGDIGVESAIWETYDYAKYFEKQFLNFSDQSSSGDKSELDKIFKPLHDSQTHVIHLNKSKAKQNWLRIYALRIESNKYVITGGAIKLTRTMQEREHTKEELKKMENVRNFLIQHGIDRNQIESVEL